MRAVVDVSKRMRLAAPVVVLAVFLIPRLWMLHGVDKAHVQGIGDAIEHVHNVHRLRQQVGEPAGSPRHPAIDACPGSAEMSAPMRWPRGVYYVALPFAALFGMASPTMILLTHTVFFLVLAGALIGLGWALGSLWAGWAAALLAGLMPPLVASTFYFNLDFPLAAMVLFAVFLLVLSRGFTRWPACLGLSAVSCLGILVKLSFPLYLGLPALTACVMGIRTHGARQVLPRAAAYVGLTAVGGLWISGLDPRVLFDQLWIHLATTETVNPDSVTLFPKPLSMAWFTAIPAMVLCAAPYPLVLLALPGLALLRRRLPGIGLPEVVSFIVGLLLVQTLMLNKLERYVQPLYPLLGLFTALGWRVMLPARGRNLAFSATVFLYGLTLVASMREPPPWHLPEWIDPTSDFMYEMRLPSESQRLAARLDPPFPGCRAGALAEALRALPLTRPGPLLLTLRFAPEDMVHASLELLTSYLRLSLLDRAPNRRVLLLDECLREKPAVRRQLPYELVITSGQRTDLIAEIPSRTVIFERHPVLVCDQTTVRLHLRLFQGDVGR